MVQIIQGLKKLGAVLPGIFISHMVQIIHTARRIDVVGVRKNFISHMVQIIQPTTVASTGG